ncbi:MAG: FAD-dependent oxidoreductase, partial [Actinomycetota bacterium]|nr:FAD-dependent oxidoreductase [Actinomycetota bacterium]
MSVGSQRNPLRVAIIGSGPSGFYAAEHILAQDDIRVQVDMFDRLPTPFGLVRAGVAPDHPKIKSVTRVYDKVAQHPDFRFRGNVEFGSDLEYEDLLEYFHAVIFCVGARSDRRLGISREYLPGSHGASDFVGWYNASPDQRNLTFDFSGDDVVVVGNGNVAMDVARVLMLPPDELAATDIAGHALRALSQNKVRQVTILGRRGPAQAAFTYRELKELADRDDIDVIVDPADMQLDPHSLHDTQQAPDRGRDQVLDLLRELAERPSRGHDRRIVFRFLVSPVEIIGTERVEGVEVVRNELYRGNNGELRARATEDREVIPADVVFRAIGY